MVAIRRAGSTTLPPLRQRETVGAFSREQTAVFIRIFMGAEGRLRGSSSAAYSMQSNSLTKRVSTWAIIQTLHHGNAKKQYSNPYFYILILHPLPIHYPALLNISIAYIYSWIISICFQGCMFWSCQRFWQSFRGCVLQPLAGAPQQPEIKHCQNKKKKKSLQWHTACQWL